MSKRRTALGHRERQIVETVYRLGEASVGEVLSGLEDPPSYSSVRAMLGSLVEKKVLRFRREGKRYLYRPAVAKETAQKSALKNLLSTFFAGRASEAMAALLDVSDVDLSDDELRQMKRMIEAKRKRTRSGDES